MKNIYVMIFLMLILITGCAGTTSRKIVETNVKEGTKGIEMSFFDGTPPNTVFEASDFLISAQISNQGATDVTAGYLTISTEKEYMGLIDWKSSIISSSTPENAMFAIQGKSQSNPAGDSSVITIRAKTLTIDPQSETHTSTIVMTACYPYKTTFSTDVCVDPDMYTMKAERKACVVKLIGLSSQGGPVAVTRIEPQMLIGDDGLVRPQFTLYLRNEGNGAVFDINSMETVCSSASLRKEDVNFVQVKAKLSDKTLTCKPTSIHLKDTDNMVRCSSENGYTGGSNSFVAPLVVEISYGYSFSITKEIIIRRVK
ncbi:MAG: hypothetical protein V1837_01050 [Candidatus Woesearchaeota archaeon]